MNSNQTNPLSDVELEVIRASEITPKKIKWLWYPYIPFGKVTLLQGDPGDGKSKLMLALSATLSRGKPLPFADDTVVPRFTASAGDRDRLIFISEKKKNLTFGDNRIREAIEKYKAGLLILDPLSSYIGDSCSLNAANETRAAFNHLITVARDTGCAVVIIAHMNKSRETSPLYRTSGSIDIAGSVRSILAIARTKNQENPSERVMVQVKSNLAPTGSAILFEVKENGVDFLDELDLTAEQALSALVPKQGRPCEKLDAATDFIRSMLKDGRMLANDCEMKLEAAGFKKSTVKKAKRNAGVLSEKDGFVWYWSMPAADAANEKWQKDLFGGDLPF